MPKIAILLKIDRLRPETDHVKTVLDFLEHPLEALGVDFETVICTDNPNVRAAVADRSSVSTSNRLLSADGHIPADQLQNYARVIVLEDRESKDMSHIQILDLSFDSIDKATASVHRSVLQVWHYIREAIDRRAITFLDANQEPTGPEDTWGHLYGKVGGTGSMRFYSRLPSADAKSCIDALIEKEVHPEIFLFGLGAGVEASVISRYSAQLGFSAIIDGVALTPVNPFYRLCATKFATPEFKILADIFPEAEHPHTVTIVNSDPRKMPDLFEYTALPFIRRQIIGNIHSRTNWVSRLNDATYHYAEDSHGPLAKTREKGLIPGHLVNLKKMLKPGGFAIIHPVENPQMWQEVNTFEDLTITVVDQERIKITKTDYLK